MGQPWTGSWTFGILIHAEAFILRNPSSLVVEGWRLAKFLWLEEKTVVCSRSFQPFRPYQRNGLMCNGNDSPKQLKPFPVNPP